MADEESARLTKEMEAGLESAKAAHGAAMERQQASAAQAQAAAEAEQQRLQQAMDSAAAAHLEELKTERETSQARAAC